jgi:hypothetical protein
MILKYFLQGLLGSCLMIGHSLAQSPVTLSRAEYEDRVNAIWHGQMLAVFLTLRFEHQTAAAEAIDGLPRPYSEAWVDDDWYYELAALRAFEKHGLALSIKQLGDQWLENHCGSYGSSAMALRNLRAGIVAPDCGHPRYNRLWWTIGPVFSSEIYGAICPAMPNEAGRMAREYGHINGYAESVDGGVFNAAAISLGFVERDTQRIVCKAANMLDPSSPYRQAVQMVIDGAGRGESFDQIAMAIEDRWHIEYPATNNAVANGGLAAASLWFGEGDFWKTVNLASRAADFTDTDNSAAGAIAVIAAMKGMAALPPELVSQLNDRLVGIKMHNETFNPSVDERISDIARRTADIGEKVIVAQGGSVQSGTLEIVAQEPRTQAAERFVLNDLLQYWNPDWTLHRAGFGGDDLGAMRGIRGITYLNGDTLITYPRDETRGLYLSRSAKLGQSPKLHFEVAAEARKAWELNVYVGNDQVLNKVIEGDNESIRWQAVELDLSKYANEQKTIRLYQRVLLPGLYKVPSNAHWKSIRLE